MGKGQTNPVTARTRQAITGAFLDQIREQEYADISITLLCARAGVARKTFYNNFGSKDDVVRCLISDFARDLESRMDPRRMNSRQMLFAAFQAVHDNRDMLLLFHERGLFRFARRSLSEHIVNSTVMAQFGGDTADARACRYVAAYIPAVLISMAETWIENGLSETPEYLAGLTESLLGRAPGGGQAAGC